MLDCCNALWPNKLLRKARYRVWEREKCMIQIQKE